MRRIGDEQRVRLAETLESVLVAEAEGVITRPAATLGVGLVLHTVGVLTGLGVEEVERELLPLTRARLVS